MRHVLQQGPVEGIMAEEVDIPYSNSLAGNLRQCADCGATVGTLKLPSRRSVRCRRVVLAPSQVRSSGTFRSNLPSISKEGKQRSPQLKCSCKYILRMIHLEVGDVSEDGINEDPKHQSKSHNGQQSHHLGHVPLEEALILVDNQPDTPGTPSSC